MLTNCALPYCASRVHSRMQPNSCRTAHFRSAMIGPLYVHSLVALPVVDARLPAAMATAKMTDDQVMEVCRKCVPARERTHACARMPIRRYGHADARTHSTHAQHLSHTSWQRTRFGREHPHNDRPSSPSLHTQHAHTHVDTHTHACAHTHSCTHAPGKYIFELAPNSTGSLSTEITRPSTSS